MYGLEYYNLLASFMANPPAVFQAMRTGKPYPVKAMFNAGGNTLMSYANQNGILEGIMNLDLAVVFDHYMTPTAQLADYVLPSDYYLERIALRQLDHTAGAVTQQQVMEPVGECKHLYFVIKGLADRMGLAEHFPWQDFEEVINWRIQSTGMTWDEYSQTHIIPPSKMVNPLASECGFATPSGKIELYSSVLEELGYDPLPHYNEPMQSPISSPALAQEYPLTLFAGLRDHHNYLTNLRQIQGLRDKQPWPETYLHPKDVARYGLQHGQWAWVETTTGRIKLLVKADEIQPEGTIRIPHGWWFPELPGGPETGFSGAMLYNDGLVLSDEAWNMDPEQGIVNMRGGMLAKIYPADPPETYTEQAPNPCYYVTRPVNG